MWRYLRNEILNARDIALIRAYLRQWIGSRVWDQNPHRNAGSIKKLITLRRMIDELTSVEKINRWISIAIDEGMDPL
jgi:hypothetical protein